MPMQCIPGPFFKGPGYEAIQRPATEDCKLLVTLQILAVSTVVQPSSYRESHTEMVDLAIITRDLRFTM